MAFIYVTPPPGATGNEAALNGSATVIGPEYERENTRPAAVLTALLILLVHPQYIPPPGMTNVFCALLLGGLLLSSCGSRSSVTTDVNQAALAAHRTVAILPFEVSLKRLRGADIRLQHPPTPAEWRQEKQRERREMAYDLQTQLREALRQQNHDEYTVQFQPVSETNRRLRAAGISYDSLFAQPVPALRRALGVDAVLWGRAVLYQPLPNGVAVAARLLGSAPLLGNGPLNGNDTRADLTIHDGRTGALVWRLAYRRSGAVLPPAELARALVKSSVKTFPYCR